MTSQVISLLPILLLALGWGLRPHEAARVSAGATIASSTTEPTMTTNISPNVDTALEDPSESSTSDTPDEEYCSRCFELVRSAQKMYTIQLQLVKKVDKLAKLYRQRHKQSMLSPSSSSSTTTNSTTNGSGSSSSDTRRGNSLRRPQSQQNSIQQSASSPSTRSLMTINEPVVVSTLRVARSASAEGDQSLRDRNKNEFKKDLLLRQMRQLKEKQVQQLNETCYALHAVDRCVTDITHECMGDLNYHSHDTYSRQWHNKLNCPPSNNPTAKVFPRLVIPKLIPDDESEQKVPILRPIPPTDEEIKLRIEQTFGPRGPFGPLGPIGVMLKPTLTDSASQQFDSLRPQQQRADTRSYEEHHHQYAVRTKLEPKFISYTSQMLLIPCCLILIVAIIAVSNRYIKKLESEAP